MGYKVVDFHNETVEDGFPTEGKDIQQMTIDEGPFDELKTGDTVVAKNSYGAYKKGKIERVCPKVQGYYVRFEDDTWRFCKEEYVRKVPNYFSINCVNCRNHKDDITICWNRGCSGNPAKDDYYHKRWEPKDPEESKNVQVPHIDGIALDGNAYMIVRGRGCAKTETQMTIYKKLFGLDYDLKRPDIATSNPFEEFYKKELNAKFGLNEDGSLRDDIKAQLEFVNYKKENKNMKKQQRTRNRNIIRAKSDEKRKIKEIRFNGPATIIMWERTFDQWAYDKKADKTVTVAKEPDKFDKTTGFLLAVLKEVLTNQSYGNVLEKIDEIKEFDEFSKQTVEADLNNKNGIHCSIKDLEEQVESLKDVYPPGSVVRYKNGKKYYMVYCYSFNDRLKETVYILQAYKGTCFTDNNLESTYKRNVPHSKLVRVRSK